MKAVFTNEENTQISWTNEQGQVWFVPYPLGDGQIPNQVQEWLDEGNSIGPYVAPPPPVPQSITRRQCAIELRERTMITAQEALNMTKYGDVPTMISQLFAQMADEDRIKAETDFAADTYMRTNPLLISIMTQSGSTEEDIDQFFRDASER